MTHVESSLYTCKHVTRDGREFARLLTAYAHLINDNNDVKRLKAVVNELKGKEVLGRKGEDYIQNVIAPVVKSNSSFADFLMSVLWHVCFERIAF